MTTSLDRCGCGAAVSPPTVLCWTCAGERRTLPNAKPAALASCGCRDRVDIPHALNCPENVKDAQAAEPPCCRFTWHPEHPQGSCKPKPAEPQSEPPIADGVGVGIANLFMGHEAETAGKVLARAYLALKAERDALRAENAAKYEEIASERHSYILLEAERQRLYDGNAALKARVEELEQIMVLHFIIHRERTGGQQ